MASTPPTVLYPLPQGVHISPNAQLDHRSDEDISQELQTFRPVTSNKNIWTFWNTGWALMRGWNQRNVIQWVRRLGPQWTVRVLDRVEGSPNNVYNFLSELEFPLAFNRQTMTGRYVGAHSADLVRLPCIYHYGGVWMDVSILLFRHMDDICWNVLDDESSGYEMAGFTLPGCHKEHQMEYGYMENWFIASARVHNPFIERWHAVFREYWSDIEESAGVKTHALFAHLDTEGYRQDMLDYLAQHASFQRVRTTVDIHGEWDGPRWHQEKLYLLDGRKEGYYFPQKTGWKGQKGIDLLRQQRSQPSSQENVGENGALLMDDEMSAEKICTYVVSNTCLMKNVHGFKGDTQLSDFWNQKQYEDCDREPNSYADFLRQASLHYQQERSLEPLKIISNGSERILHAQILQPEAQLARLKLDAAAKEEWAISHFGNSMSSTSIATSSTPSRSSSSVSLASSFSTLDGGDDNREVDLKW